MDALLIQDTLRLLKQELAADSAVQLEIDEARLDEIVSLLHCYDISRSCKIVILGGYLLICLAFSKHRDLKLDGGLSLTRGILDGDYLIGQYFGWLLKYSELQLASFLAPVHKKMQIAAALGLTAEPVYDEMLTHVKKYLNTERPKGGDTDEAA